MSAITATEAKNRFGELLEMSRSGPVPIQKNGRVTAYVVEARQFEQMQENAAPKVNPLIAKLHAESKQRWGKVYEALAK